MDKDKNEPSQSAVDAEAWRLEELEEAMFNYRLDLQEYIRESEGE